MMLLMNHFLYSSSLELWISSAGDDKETSKPTNTEDSKKDGGPTP